MDKIRGKRRRPRALRLNVKLRQIREAYGLSQSEMVSRLGLNDALNPSDISAFERDPENKWSREPALPQLLRYARIAGIAVEVLIDPALELPDKLAPDPMHGVIKLPSRNESRKPMGKVVKKSQKISKRPLK